MSPRGGVIAAMEGDKERALLVIRKIEDAKMGPISFNFIGYIYHALGDLDSFGRPHKGTGDMDNSGFWHVTWMSEKGRVSR